MPTTETLNQSPTIGAIDNADLLWVWNTSSSALNKVSRANLVGATLTGGGTITTNGATFTIPAAGGEAAILTLGRTAFTPTIIGSTTTGTGTYTTQIGRYSIISGIVFAFARIITSAHTGTGNLRLSLPVAAASGLSGMIMPVNIFAGNVSNSSGLTLQGAVSSTQDFVTVYTVDTDGTNTIGLAPFDATVDIAYTAIYMATL